jgi:signal transduction histidine kinase/DNA-binding NarL/FixJ family response regulator
MLAYVLSKNFTNAFYRIEKLSIHLNTLLEERKKYQGELEQRVKERTNDLIKAKEAAENANKSKSEFLAKMSHEMRTPLNCILGFCEIVQSSDDEKQKKEYIRQVIKESERLLSLINELLDLSKIEAGKLKLENISFNLEDLMDTITSTIGLHAKNKGLDFQILISDDVPKVMEGDPIRLRQILINLAGNAVKFTEKGYVHINIVLIHKSAAETELKFIIKDSGIGIPKNKRLDIFENFVQADSSTTRKYGGSGLGTSIAKQLVQMMNGKIDFHSEENNGSTFWFTAVFKTSDQSEKNDEIYGEAASPPVLSGKNILIVDDYEPNRQIIKLFLEKTGCYFDEAENGREAVESCRINKYHLILMDVQMPELDGNKASTEIRTLPNYKKIPIIGMTANAFRNDIEASLEAGMNDVLTKPVRKKNLYSVITAFSAETAPSSSYKTISSRYEKADNTFNTNDAPLDYYGFVEELGNDRQAANQIIESFLIKAGEQLINIKKSLSEEDFPLIHREAHTIKGGALNLLASGLASISAKIEAEAKAGNSEHITDNLETLKLELEKLSSFMKDK